MCHVKLAFNLKNNFEVRLRFTGELYVGLGKHSFYCNQQNRKCYTEKYKGCKLSGFISRLEISVV